MTKEPQEIAPVKKHRRRKLSRRAAMTLLAFIIPLAIFSYVTNPFVRFSIIVDPYKKVEFNDGQFSLQNDSSLFVRNDAFFQKLAQLKSGWHIIGTRFSRGKQAKDATIDGIIRDIHALRFNPEEPYLISGDHFSVLYPRSLGIFYHSILDARTALDEKDWENRQLIYLKTLAYALQVYDKAGRLSTTIVPVGPRSVALANYWAPPSDTMYSLLYALQISQDDNVLMASVYPYETETQSQFTLEIQKQSQTLLDQHKDSLRGHYQKYFTDVYDPETGLIRKDLTLSGAKDIARRQSAFYDNVIFWRTTQLAQQLGVIDTDAQFLVDLKKRIIEKFWLEKEGYFLEDLSPQSLEKKYYSSDWLIAQMTGFISPSNPEELPYFVRTVQYIQRNAIDQPFGLQYHPDDRREQRFRLSGWFAPAYGSSAIWSNWGMEYIKLLSILAQQTKDSIYLEQADAQISAYAFNMKRYRGYPELYDKNGDIFKQTFYQSVVQTGWVVSYEQARAMYDWTRAQAQVRRTED